MTITLTINHQLAKAPEGAITLDAANFRSLAAYRFR